MDISNLQLPFRPIRLEHFYMPIIFGLYYTAFSLIYWTAGGVGVCMPKCLDLPLNSTGSMLDDSCPVKCDK